MNIVLIHIGCELPIYFWDCCEQVRRFFPGNIHIIIPSKYTTDNSIKRIGLHPVSYEALIKNPFYKRFEKICYLRGFWNVTMGRLFLLQLLMMEKRLLDVIHIENDVLLYADPNKYSKTFEKLGHDSFLICPVGNNYASAAYVYAKNFQIIGRLNLLFLHYFEKGRSYIESTIGKEITEMTMMAFCCRIHKGVIKYLPICPEGRGSQNFNHFDSLFDGASAGQYIGGTASGLPGWAGKHHWLGEDILNGKYSFCWGKNDKGLKIPYLVHGSKKYRLNNLHIHSKRLKEFM